MNDPETDVRQTTERKSILRNALGAIDALQAKLDRVENDRHEPIAIVGLSCRFPGSANADAFWTLLREGRNAVTEVPPGRWDQAAYFDPDPTVPGKMHAPFGGFLADIGLFDAAFFGISAREAETLDPQQRLLLEVTWEALEHAGLTTEQLKGSATGVFVGITTSDYARLAAAGDPAELDVYSATGGALNAAAGRLSFVLGLNGPAMAIDTACSSSLVALHLACQSLRSRECDAALAGGVNVLLTPEPFVCFAKWGMMAPDGRCKTFDEKADGFVRAEGCGIVVLKRLSDAQAAGDRVLAVIRGTAVNQDGASSGLTVPNGLAQQAVLRSALKSARLEPEQLDYIEAHGTGTTLGDPIELEAIAAVLGRNRSTDRPLLIGSVKTNLGHTESASGIAGLIKVVLAMQRETIPPHLNFQKLSSRISLGNVPIEIPVRSVAWPRSARPRLAGISSFGFSGTNAHAILEEAPLPAARSGDPASTPDRTAHLLVLSAKSGPALQELAAAYQRQLTDLPAERWPDVCHAAAVGRSALSHRLAILVDEPAATLQRLEAAAAGEAHAGLTAGRPRTSTKVAFLFSETTADAGRGHSLYQTSTVFRDAFDQCSKLFDHHAGEALEIGRHFDADFAAARFPDSSELVRTHAFVFAFDYALAQLWRSWGIEPAVVVGYGVGEYVAACIAGGLSVEDATRLVTGRARLAAALRNTPAAIEVLASLARVNEAIAAHSRTVAISAVNSPGRVIVAGPAGAISTVVTQLQSEGVTVNTLPARPVFHSLQVEPMLAALAQLADTTQPILPAIDFVTTHTGAVLGESALLDASHWRHHARQPIQFASSILTLRELGVGTCLEIGPTTTLIEWARETSNEPDLAWLPSFRVGADDWSELLLSLGALFVGGHLPDWRAFDRGHARQSLELPRYPFQRKHHWLKSAPSKPAAVLRTEKTTRTSTHPWLGVRQASPLRQIQFPCTIDLIRWPVLSQHRVAGTVLFPAAGFIELGDAVARAVWPDHPFVRVEQGWLRAALVLAAEPKVEIQVVVTPAGIHTADFEVFSRRIESEESGEWKSHAGGRLTQISGDNHPGEIADAARGRCLHPIDIADYRRRMAEVGLEYGPSFLALVAATRGEQEAFGTLRLPADDRSVSGIHVHPGLLDAAFQLIGIALGNTTREKFFLPVKYESAELLCSVGSEAHAHVRLRSVESTGLKADITVWRADGKLALRVGGLQTRAITREQFRELVTSPQNESLLRIAWRPAPLLAAQMEPGSAWAVIGNDESLVSAVHLALKARGVVSHTDDSTTLERRIENLREKGAISLQGIVDLRALEVRDNGAAPSAAFANSAGAGPFELLRLIAAHPPREPLRLVIPTLLAQAVDPDDAVNPLSAVLWGLAATAQAESSGVEIRLVDLAHSSDTTALLVDVALRTDQETKLAVRGSDVFVSRLVPLAAAPVAGLVPPEGPHELVMSHRGTLSGLGVKRITRVNPPAGYVEIAVLASGLNFRDVLNLLDMYPGPAGPLGNECCGKIVAVGPGVEGCAVGDLVTCIADATFASHVTAKARLTFPVPAELSLAQAAAFPIAQLTAYLALHRVGKIRAGDRVLVHAGAGGVGLAAIHLALAAGAVVYATAGSEEKRQHLKALGVTAVFDSRKPLSSAVVRVATGGHGVDLLLNSLTGEFIDEGLKSLATGGRFLEIGLRELRTAEAVHAIRDDVTYFPLLLGEYCQREPAMVRAMYDELVACLRAGKIPPPRVRTYPLARAESAFRYMAKAHHIGRIVIMAPAVDQPRVRADGSYLITGGLGAIGLHMAKWLVTQGARHVLLMGRSDPSIDAAERIAGLRACGAKVDLIKGDVASPADLAFLPRLHPPVRGILHAAGIMDDASLPRVDSARLVRAMKPKSDGARNLVNAVASTDLDFLVFFSSGSALLGSPGQAAYAAANAYLDAFANQLRTQGVMALSINWGPWAEGGMAARVDEKIAREWAGRGLGFLSVATAELMLQNALTSGLAQVAALPIDWSKFFHALPGHRGPAFLSELGAPTGDNGASSAAARAKNSADSSAQPSAESAPADGTQLMEIMAAVLGLSHPRDLDPATGLVEQGMDSLIAMELRNRLQAELGILVTADRLLRSPTPDELVQELTRESAVLVRPEPVVAQAFTEGEI